MNQPKQLQTRFCHEYGDADDPSRRTEEPDWAKYKTIAQRLEKLYGTGDNPQLRRKLYVRIQSATIEHGPDCYDVVLACVKAASLAECPDRYFCCSVTAEMKSLGYWELPTTF
jgi:hypothetical protein